MTAVLTPVTVVPNPTIIATYAAVAPITGQAAAVKPAALFAALSSQTAKHAARLIELASFENLGLNLLGMQSGVNILGNKVNLGTVFLSDYAVPCDAGGNYPAGNGRYADGSKADHTADYQAAINVAIARNAALDVRGFDYGLQISSQVTWRPVAGKSEFSISVVGPAVVQYIGGSGTNLPGGRSVNYVVGMRNSSVVSVGTGIRTGVQDVYIWDFDTEAGNPNIDSTSQIDMVCCGALLGNGVNNCCYRYGHKSGAGADVSNIRVSRSLIFGVQAGYPGGVPQGMTAFKYEGHNTITNSISNCLIAYVYYGVSTMTQAYGMSKAQYAAYTDGNGNTQNGAGGIVINDATVFSHCIQDILYPSLQSLLLQGTRHEDSQHFLDIPDSYQGGNITLDTVQIDNCAGKHPMGWKDGSILFCGGPYSIKWVNPNIRNYQRYGDHMFVMNCYSGEGGTMLIDGGFMACNDLFVRFGNATDGSADPASNNKAPAGRLYTRGVKKLDQYGNVSGWLADHNGN